MEPAHSPYTELGENSLQSICSFILFSNIRQCLRSDLIPSRFSVVRNTGDKATGCNSLKYEVNNEFELCGLDDR